MFLTRLVLREKERESLFGHHPFSYNGVEDLDSQSRCKLVWTITRSESEQQLKAAAGRVLFLSTDLHYQH